jgi:hypothetical protein
LVSVTTNGYGNGGVGGNAYGNLFGGGGGIRPIDQASNNYGLHNSGASGFIGRVVNIDGNNTRYGGGGNGGIPNITSSSITGTNIGKGGDGTGASLNSASNGRAGGSGIVIIKYYTLPTPPPEQTLSLDPVVWDGLQIYLNANEPASYSASSSTWTNLYSEGAYNATLVAAPTYDATAKGIVFNGTTQYAEIADNANLRATADQSITVQIWAKVPAAPGATAKGIVSKQYGAPSYDGYALDFDGTNKVRLRMNGGTVDIQQSAATNNSYVPSAWQLFSMVVDFNGSETLIYVNNSQVLTNTNAETSIPSNTAPIRLASGIQEGSNLLACTIGAMYYYNRALTPSEIVQNFDATKSYYGVV